MKVVDQMLFAAKELKHHVDLLHFSLPVTHVYNPLDYAWDAHEHYIKKYGAAKKDVVFLGMNPGPWGMAQIGVPFGEVSLVKNWLGIHDLIKKPLNEHPKRPIEGFNCKRSEVSGRRLWGLFKERFGSAEKFFEHHYVANYCPLVFMEESGKNSTPDKFSKTECEKLFMLCDEHLRKIVHALKPRWVIGVGAFAEKRALEALTGADVKIIGILHPSPASPAANKGWDKIVAKSLEELCIWQT